MPKALPLADAVASFDAALAETTTGKAELKKESRVLAGLLSINGNIYVHQVTAEHITRAFDPPLEAELATLRGFFDWTRRHGWISPKADPLENFEKPTRRRPHPLDQLSLGNCSRCHRDAVLIRVGVTRRDPAERVRLELCRKCRNKATLPELLALGGP